MGNSVFSVTLETEGLAICSPCPNTPLRYRKGSVFITGHGGIVVSLDCKLVPLEQLDIVSTFADQAVIAIENVRLFGEIQAKSEELAMANQFKSRFLSAASHDLRQPLHALNLFVEQLSNESNQSERTRLVSRIGESVGAINELFEALLDMSKL